MSNELATRIGLDMVGSLADVMTLSENLARAGGGFIPAHFKNAGQVAAVILAGREMGVPPMASLRSFFLIDGKLGMDAAFILGRMIATGIVCEWMHSDDTRATLRVTRAGTAPYVSTFTREDATRAGLWGRGPWSKYPQAMLRARAATAAARAYAPDVFSGAVYTAEELRGGDEEHAPQAAPQRVEVMSVQAAGAAVASSSSADAREPGTVSRLLEAIDVAGSEVELRQIKELGVNPAWKSMTNAERADVKAYFERARGRIAAVNRAAVEAMERDVKNDDGGYLASDADSDTGEAT